MLCQLSGLMVEREDGITVEGGMAWVAGNVALVAGAGGGIGGAAAWVTAAH